MSIPRPDHARPASAGNLPFRAIDSSNWQQWQQEYEADGGLFVAMPAVARSDYTEATAFARRLYGYGNVVVGDAFDHDRGLPMRDDTSVGLYVKPAGLEHVRKHWLRRP